MGEAMNVLIVKNVLSEGPGTIEDHLRAKAVPYRVLELYGGAPLPPSASFTHLVVLGGPMAVYEMEKYPYLVREAALIQEAIKAGKVRAEGHATSALNKMRKLRYKFK
jgi:GMP synthase-like glutamine amidotransferase